jgi:hypothetical protein
MPDQKFNSQKDKFNFRNKEKIYTFLICLGLSSFLWFLNALEKQYNERISVPVNYINIPKNKKPSGPLPEQLDMTVNASGYTILRHKIKFLISPLLLDVNELTNHNLENKYISKYAITTNSHKEEIARQLSNDMEILNVRPDTILFNMSPLIEKKIKVHPVVKLTFYKEFTLKSPPFTNPDSIWVQGPQNVLDTLKAVNTKPYFFESLSHNLLRNAKLDLLPGLNSITKEVLLTIPVEQSTEVTFEIPIHFINIPDTLLIKTFPSIVKVICRIGLSEYSIVSQNSFSAIINYRNISRTKSKLPVLLDRFPKRVLSVDYFPKEVEYVIELKK